VLALDPPQELGSEKASLVNVLEFDPELESLVAVLVLVLFREFGWLESFP